MSDIGKERANNEDAVSACPDLARPVWSGGLSTPEYVTLSSCGAVSVVADGMGGANAGEVASALAIESIQKSFDSADIENVLATDDSVRTFLKDCIIKSNKAIFDYVVTSPDSVGLGTTVVLLWIVNGKAYVMWCGDSRCYCFNPHSGLKLLTKDHSLVQELVDKGEIKVEDTFNHPDNNIITRCLGDVDADSEPEILTCKVADGDLFLLCSDGLSGYCRDSEIEKVMYEYYGHIDKCRHSLLQLALNAGGQDNITISLCATLPETQKASDVGFWEKVRRFVNGR